MPSGVVGRSLCRCARSTPGQRDAKPAKRYWTPLAAGRSIDLVLVWRLDRWGRSVTDLLATLQELEHLGVGFVSLTEALDLTTPAGRAMAGLLAVFAAFEREILQERTKAGLAHARENGQRLGRPLTAGLQAAKIRKLHRAGLSKSEIARRLQIGRTSVRRILVRPISG
jgi:putative DNA-invertase from lambdoid prophage Rac